MKTLKHISGFELLKIQEDIKLTQYGIDVRKVGIARVNKGDFEGTISDDVIGTYYSIHSKQLQTMLPYYLVIYSKKDGSIGTIYAN